MIRLGDKVVSRKTGYPGSGEVCGIVYAGLYVATTQKKMEDFGCWNDLYPDWTDKTIVYVRFEEPRKTVTKEEYAKYLPEGYEKYDLETLYAFQIPFTNVIGYPVDDLELFEQNEDSVQNIIRGAGFNE